MMKFSLEEVFSNLYRVANTLPIESPSLRTKFGEHDSPFRGEGYDFDRIVEYDPTVHSLSQIDWRSLTRDSVLVREYKVSKDFPVTILGDVSASMLFGIEHQSKEKMFLEVIGDIGLACFHAQDPMGFMGFAENIIFDEEPKVGEDNIYYLLEQLYEFFDGLASDGKGRLLKKKTDFYNAFDCLINKYGDTRHFIVVISDFIGLEKLPSLQILEDAAAHHEIVFIFLDDPQEFGAVKGPGYVRIEDMETGKQNIVSRKRFHKMGANIRQQRRKLRDSLQEIGIDSMVLEYGKHFQRLHRFFDARYEMLRS
jgi:uncharacterized protein (DUF58 family)